MLLSHHLERALHEKPTTLSLNSRKLLFGIIAIFFLVFSSRRCSLSLVVFRKHVVKHGRIAETSLRGVNAPGKLLSLGGWKK